MKRLVPQFESFFKLSCKYLADNSNDDYYEGHVGIPTEYAKMRDKKFVKNVNSSCKKFNKKSKKGFKHKVNDFVFNNHGTVACDSVEGRVLICDGVNAFRHKKKANVRISTRPQNFTKPPEIATDFYYENFEVFKNFEDFKLDDHVVVSGCFDTNRHTVQQQMDCENFSGNPVPVFDDYLFMKSAIHDSIKKLQVVDLGGVNISQIQDFDFNLNTKPGYRFEHYFNAHKKINCVDIAVRIAEERYKRIVNTSKLGEIIKRRDIIPGIYTIGARNARKDTYEAGESITSRAVHMPEWHTELHGGVFSDLITAHFVEKGEGPIYIGNSFSKCDRLEKQLKNNFCAVEGDWSKFDASLCNSLITMSVSILRLYFPPGLLYDNHFLAILDTLIIKDYHIVGGDVLRILQGLPSGSKWTSLVGSVLNLIVLNYSFSGVKSYDRSFAIGGDDFVTFIKNNNYSLDKIEIEVENKSVEIGMNLKFFKKKFYKYSDNVDDYPVFYKYTVFDGVPVIPLESILERVLSPWNKMYKNSFEILKFLDNLMPSLAFPTSSCFIYYEFYRYCYYRVTGKLISVKELAKSHYILYHKMKESSFSYSEFSDSLYTNKRNVFTNHYNITDYVSKVFCL